MPESKPPPEIRRWLALAISIALFATAVFFWLASSDSSGEFFAAACFRIGLVLGALWLAWPQLKRPARWLPASAPVIGVIGLIAIAAQPRLVFPAIAIVGTLITLSTFVQLFRKRRK
ncbi:MAG: hypothetical protein AAFX06_04315 [Planctomycetota bacterium]